MKTHTLKITSLIIITTLLLSACSALPAAQVKLGNNSLSLNSSTETQVENSPTLPQTRSNQDGVIAAYEGALQNVYTQVNPSVVNIRVVQKQDLSTFSQGQLPFNFDLPEGSQPDTPQYAQGLGSGFIWDSEGHIVTNNHVLEGADKIEVTFADGTTLPATLVGADSYSDLAVIQVEGAPDLLHPVQMGDSEQVKVGELAIAIGNPFGLEGTMTVGIISALGRTLPASSGMTVGPVYSIPDIIQTDAPINPGNSGGVLVNDQGEVIGVTAAIESAVNSNAGIGFVIPSTIVSKVVPSLIQTGTYEHPYLGISGTSLTPDMVQEMNLQVGQRGVQVITVAEGGPAAKAGLRPSQDSITVDGQDVPVGGDVIIAINGETIAKMDDLIAYLADETEVGQEVTLTVLRDGNETSLDVTLEARPLATTAPEEIQNSSENKLPNPENQNKAWLGILGAQLTPDIAKAMNFSEDQQGILVVQVEGGSPADQANLSGSNQPLTLNGETVMIGGDVITAVDGNPITTLTELRSLISSLKPGTEVTLTILRDGSTIEVPVTLAERPANIP
jgi:S1-C subfamily serine protease